MALVLGDLVEAWLAEVSENKNSQFADISYQYFLAWHSVTALFLICPETSLANVGMLMLISTRTVPGTLVRWYCV